MTPNSWRSIAAARLVGHSVEKRIEQKVTERNGEEEERILVVGNKSELSGS